MKDICDGFCHCPHLLKQADRQTERKEERKKKRKTLQKHYLFSYVGGNRLVNNRTSCNPVLHMEIELILKLLFVTLLNVLSNICVIIAFINSSLYSCETYRQIKEMVILHLFIEHQYKYIVLSIRERHVLTLHVVHS